MQDKLNFESEEYGDIIQENFVDSYANLRKSKSKNIKSNSTISTGRVIINGNDLLF